MQNLSGLNKIIFGHTRPIRSAAACLLLFLPLSLLSCRNKYKPEVIGDAHAIVLQTADNYAQGKRIFKNACASCHFPPEKEITCQYLFDDLFTRLPEPSDDYFRSYISDTRKLIAAGNEYAKAVQENYNNAYEHRFKDSLSQKQLTSLIVYIKIAAKLRYRNSSLTKD